MSGGAFGPVLRMSGGAFTHVRGRFWAAYMDPVVYLYLLLVVGAPPVVENPWSAPNGATGLCGEPHGLKASGSPQPLGFAVGHFP
jgi:hypothetical protein